MTEMKTANLKESEVETEMVEDLEIEEMNIDFEDEYVLEDFENTEADLVSDSTDDEEKQEKEHEEKEQEQQEELQEEEQEELQEEELEEQQEEELKEATFSLEDLTPSVTNVVNRNSYAGLLSLVKSKKNGNRASFAQLVLRALGYPKKVQIGFSDGRLFIGSYLGKEYTFYTLKEQGAKYVIYSKQLVEQIAEHCNLDFSNRTSITFTKVTYQKLNGQIIAIISLN